MPGAALTPNAVLRRDYANYQHRRREAQFPGNLYQWPTATRQQGDRLRLELIRKPTPVLCPFDTFPLPSELTKGVHQFGGGSVRIYCEP